jgi:hypothetical protein
MFAKFPLQKVFQPALDSEKSQSSQSTLEIVVLQKIVVALDECNEESLLGGTGVGEDTLPPILTASDAQAKTPISYHGIRSIPTLM